MEEILNGRFQRVETALNTLIDSITSYNASPAAAVELVAADDDLSKGLEQLSVHQSNYARILSLRQTAESLETQLKNTLSLLAETRKELLETSATTLPDSSRDVPIEELLAYAKRISRFTVPPTYRPPLPKEEAGPKQLADEEAPLTNGVSTPVAATPLLNQLDKEDGKGLGWDALPAEQKEWLDQVAKMPFVPWPSEDTIRRGGLAIIQGMVERGEDPSKVLAPEEVEAQAKRLAEEEEEGARKEREEAERRRMENVHAGGMGRGIGRQVQAEVEDLDLYNPDED